MGIKKYELITDGANKRIKALRSFQVQDRYVNIGDVGGIVYDEKTLSQDGNAWIFRGNMGSPTIRISGDAIVDLTEGAVSGSAKALLTIDGQSKVVGAAANLNVRTSGAAWTLTPALFEQGFLNYGAGTNWQTWKSDSANRVRLKQPIYVGAATGMSFALLEAGYTFIGYWLDRDGNGVGLTNPTVSGSAVNMSVPSTAVYLQLTMMKGSGATVPADVATAKPTLNDGTLEGSFLIRDSAITITNMSAGTAAFSIVQTGPGVNGASVPGSSIVNSTVNIFKPGNLAPSMLIATDMVNTKATITATAAANYDLLGVYDNVKNLMVTSELGIQRGAAGAETIITAKDCQNFAYSSTVFPGAAAAQTANRPFRFVRCNVPDGLFYDHAQILNQYTDIDFSKATADLNRATTSGQLLVSSEVQGMYRLIRSSVGEIGALVESYNSVKDWSVHISTPATYNTTIYKDCYVRGLWEFAGTNVFGRTRSHDNVEVLNAAGRAVQGMFNATATGGTITGVVAAADRVCIPVPFRSGGLVVADITATSTVESQVFTVNAQGVTLAVSGWAAGDRILVAGVGAAYVGSDKFYVAFRKAGGGNISVFDLGDAAIRLYRGCKIINTDSAAKVIKGNVRIEDDAHVIDTSITGTGYFGGNSIIQAPSALTGQLPIEGAAYMSDNAVFAPSAVIVGANVAFLDMRDNAVFAGSLKNSAASYDITMMEAARCLGTVSNSRSRIIMRGNSFVAAAGTLAPECRGLLIMEDDARIENGSIAAKGRITLCGKYNQTVSKSWTGKRVIDSEDAPTYDDNVKTQYDF